MYVCVIYDGKGEADRVLRAAHGGRLQLRHGAEALGGDDDGAAGAGHLGDQICGSTWVKR